jgi:hypothetical protein
VLVTAQVPLGPGNLHALPSAQTDQVGQSRRPWPTCSTATARPVRGVIHRPTQIQANLTLGQVVGDGPAIRFPWSVAESGLFPVQPGLDRLCHHGGHDAISE